MKSSIKASRIWLGNRRNYRGSTGVSSALVVGSTPEQLAQRVKSDLALVQRAVKETEIPLPD
jgi:hypothetical protein